MGRLQFVERTALALALTLSVAACGNRSAPIAPSSIDGSMSRVTSDAYTVSGTIITANNGGLPVADATVSIAGVATTTDASGRYELTVPSSAASTLITITGAGFLQRRAYLSASTRTIDWDVIQESGGFDLRFYRQFVRNALDSTALQPVRRWTRNPSVYLRTVDEAGAPIDAETLDATERMLTETTPMWTAQQYSATVVRGVDSRAGGAGWITIAWKTERPADRCGQTTAAADTALIEFYPHANCRCWGSGPAVYKKLVRHELGHAMGFFHTDDPGDVMYGQTSLGCDATPSARERYHAAIVYGSGDRPGRPAGNVDVDADAASAVHLTPLLVR